MALLGAGGDTCCAGTRAGRGRTDDRGLGIRILMQYPHTQPSPVYVSAYSARQGMRIRRLPKPKYPKVSMYPCVTRPHRPQCLASCTLPVTGAAPCRCACGCVVHLHVHLRASMRVRMRMHMRVHVLICRYMSIHIHRTRTDAHAHAHAVGQCWREVHEWW